MPGLKKYFPDVQFGANKVTPDEIDRYETYDVTFPSTSATWVGTAAGGTADQAKALVLINTTTDYPRNLLYSVVGTNDMGGTWVVNGEDQFGSSVTETVALATAAAGTPAVAVAGTTCFASVSSGTFTVDGNAVGNGSARLGLAIGTSATAKFWLGLPTKIGAATDVKTIAWSSEFVQTTVNGGTVTGTTFVNTSNHAISNDSIMGGTETFTVIFKPTYDAQEDGNNIANR